MAAAPTSRTDRSTVSRAVSALGKWMRGQAKQRKAQLLDHDDLIYLVVTLKRVPAPSAARTNPTLIPLPHPLISPSSSSLCVILDDRSPLTPAAITSSFPSARVITLSDLRSDYRPFESRRKLCDSHDLFLADRRILPLLPRLLGKTFFSKKKLPLAVNFSRPGWAEQVRHCCDSSLLYIRTGTCSGLKVGRLSQEVEEIVDNVVAAVDGAVDHVPKKWKNIRSLHVKSVDSLALPIYQAVPELGMKIDGSRKEEEVLVKFDDKVDGDDVEEVNEKIKRKKKVKKVKTEDMKIDGSRKEEEVLVKFDDKVDGDDVEEVNEKIKRKKKAKKVKTEDMKIDGSRKEEEVLEVDGDDVEEMNEKSKREKKAKKVKTEAPVKFDDTVDRDDVEEMDEKNTGKKKAKKVKTEAPVKVDMVDRDDAEEMDEKSMGKKKAKKVKTEAPVKFDDTMDRDDAEEMDDKSKGNKEVKEVKTGKTGKKEESDGGVVRKVKKSKVK